MVSLELLLTLNSLRIGSAFYERLLRHFGSAEAITRASPEKILRIPRVSTFAGELPKALREQRGRQELELARKHGIKVISFEDAQYPPRLKSIFDYPLVLYVKGNIKVLDNDLAVAIVGTRHNSIYGQMQAERMAYTLAQRGFCVVSGLARGIDTYAHQGVLKVKGGQTIAVLGNGLKHVYPAENKKLLERICENGVVVSELPFAMAVNKINFPTRNRIISGLSLGTVVIEAPLRSGALITADFALEQGREVFALPGKVDNPSSQGCHKLIKQGAKLIEGVEDILDELNIPSPAREVSVGARLVQSLSADEKSLLSILDASEQLSIDDIIDRVKLPSSLVLTTLLTLEMKKLVRQMPGKSYIRM
ncbi:MAG: DNA-protecting protein DprA [Planctomycetes bacterium]|nr:DNA-protecting protein DprA [Planctomycetota bacterium]